MTMLCPECPQCGYQREGLAPGRRCPECGLDTPADSVVIWGLASYETRRPGRNLVQILGIAAIIVASNTAWMIPVPRVLTFGTVIAMIVVPILYRNRRARSRREQHLLFAQSAGVSVTRGYMTPNFLPWSTFEIITLRRHGRWTLRRPRPDQPRGWKLTITTSRILRDHFRHANTSKDEYVSLIFDAEPDFAHAVHRAIEQLWRANCARDDDHSADPAGVNDSA
jgi:hypothetical protein